MSRKPSDWPLEAALPLTTLAIFGGAFLSWIAYCYLLTTAPQTFDLPWIRLAVRFFSVFLPAVVFRLVVGFRQGSAAESNSVFNQDLFCIRRRWLLGLAIGIAVAATYLIVMFLDPTRQSFRMPSTPTAWIGLVAIPVADEMLFRCILAVQIFAISQSLDGAKGWDSWIAAVILSAAAFCAFGLPAEVHKDAIALDLVVRLAIEFGFGCILAILFLTTRSIWASLIPHWAYVLVAVGGNNLTP